MAELKEIRRTDTYVDIESSFEDIEAQLPDNKHGQARRQNTREFKGTQGEWGLPHFAREGSTCNCGYVFGGQYLGAIATVHYRTSEQYNDDPPLEEAKANARLISAAPDLLIALQDMIYAWECLSEYAISRSARPYINAHSAIAKALGGGMGRRAVAIRVEDNAQKEAVRAFDKIDFTKFYHAECVDDYEIALEDVREQFLKNYNNE